jgi:alkaline phosphatase D
MRLVICCLLVCSVGAAANTRIGFGSCFNQDKSAKIWKTIGDLDLDGFLFLGDNVYASRGFSRAKLEAAYAKASVVIPWDRLGPIQATWDDHDFGRNDGGADFSERLLSQRLFWQFFGPLMDVSQPASEGVYNSRIRVIEGNKVQIIALDTRSFRGRLKPTLIRNTPGAERYVPNFHEFDSGDRGGSWLGALGESST